MNPPKSYSQILKELEYAQKELSSVRDINIILIKELDNARDSMRNQNIIMLSLKQELKEYISVHVRNTTEILKLEERVRKYNLDE
jgi:hypothetical protein